MNKFLCFLFSLLITSQALAQDIELYNTACESIRGQERKSQTISRAADTALFSAVSNIDEVFANKKTLDEPDFNIFVYNLIDNHLTDINIKTTKSNDLEACVEVNAYLSMQAIKKDQETEFEKVIQKAQMPEKRPFVFIAPTEYYNNTNSKKVSKQIETNFSNKDLFYTTDDKIIADYIIYPKVLKAKIDPINSKTNRFQMIISLDLEDQSTKEITKEHQNKFILLETTQDEQQEGKKLMEKLFSQASVATLSKLETLIHKNQKTELLSAGQ